MNASLLTDCRFVRHSNAVAAGQTNVEPSCGVDTAGFDAVLFIVAMGDITSGAATTAKLQESTDDGVVDTYADIEGSEVEIPDDGDGKLYLIETNPRSRYVRCVVTRATQDSVVEGITAILFDGKDKGALMMAGGSASATVDGTEYTSANLGSGVVSAKSLTLAARGTP